MTPSVESTTLTSASFEELAREMLIRLGEDPAREGLLRTPNRMHRAYECSRWGRSSGLKCRTRVTT